MGTNVVAIVGRRRCFCPRATRSVFHQRHIGRVLRSSCIFAGRRLTSCSAKGLKSSDSIQTLGSRQPLALDFVGFPLGVTLPPTTN